MAYQPGVSRIRELVGHVRGDSTDSIIVLRAWSAWRAVSFRSSTDPQKANAKIAFALGSFDLEAVPCDPALEPSSKELSLEDIREQYKQIQAARAEIDAKREEWLHEQAEPLLDALEDQLLDASFPQEVREEIAALREQLRNDAYGYSQLLGSAELEEMIGISARRVQELSQQGRLGKQIARSYVHSSDEAIHFAQKDRPTGKHRTKS